MAFTGPAAMQASTGARATRNGHGNQ